MGVNLRDKHSAKSGRIRVALIHYRDDAALGGSLRVGQLLGNHLDTTRIDPHFVFVYGGPGPVTASSRVPVHFVNANGPGDFGGWLRLRGLIRSLTPDMLHFLNPVFWADVALWDWRGPRIIHIHGPLPYKIKGLRSRLVFGTFRASMTRQVCVSRETKTEALRIGVARSESLCTIYNAIDCAEFQGLPTSQNARDELGLPRDAYLLGTVGRLHPDKGSLDSIRVMNYLPPDIHLVICGTGPLEESMRRDVINRKLEGRVHFLGSRDSVRAVYAAIDNLLFLSRTEPFGLVIAEAMASGVPVVGLEGEGGYSDLDYPLVARDNALLLKPDKPLSRTDTVPEPLLLSLAQAIISLRDSPETRSSMARCAQSWVQERFDIKKQAQEMADLYESLV